MITRNKKNDRKLNTIITLNVFTCIKYNNVEKYHCTSLEIHYNLLRLS